MTLSITQLQSLSAEHQAFINTLTNAQAALAGVIAAGTILYNDANFATQFPTNWAAYQAYLISCQTKITTFIAGWPVEPALAS